MQIRVLFALIIYSLTMDHALLLAHQELLKMFLYQSVHHVYLLVVHAKEVLQIV